jgi:hypothetical protein
MAATSAPTPIVHVSNSIEDGRGLVVGLAPHNGQPFARRDNFRTNENASDKAVQFLQQHRLFAKGEEFFLKLLEMARPFAHEASMSRGAVRQSC